MQFGREKKRRRYTKLDTEKELQGAPEEESVTVEDVPPTVTEESASETSGESQEKCAEQSENPTEPDWKDLYARLLADFDNFKKRTARDREEIYRYVESDILKNFLPVVDNLQLALSTASSGDDPFVKGIQLVYDTFLSALKERGAEPFDCVGQELDVEKMEAIAQLPSEDIEEGKVSNEAKRGWMLKGKVLRAAQVVVSSGKGV